MGRKQDHWRFEKTREVREVQTRSVREESSKEDPGHMQRSERNSGRSTRPASYRDPSAITREEEPPDSLPSSA
jgi:hypothetical protein